MFKNYFKTTWRTTVRNRRFTFLNLLGLSTGLASAVLIFLWVSDEIRVDKFNEKDDQLYKVMFNMHSTTEVMTLHGTPYPLVATLTKEMPEVEYATSIGHFGDWYSGDGVVSFGGKQLRAKGMFASKDHFNVFSHKLIQGTKEGALSDKNGVVISEVLAKKLFNTTQNLIGKTITWEHRMKFEGPLHVSGVVENPPANSTINFDIIFNYSLLLEKERNAREWSGTYSDTYLILKKGTNVEGFNQKIAGFAKLGDPASKNTYFIQPFSKLYLHGQFENGKQVGGRIQYVRLFSLIALLILVIACINFSNLSTAQASGKMKEIGVKKTLGGSRKSLIFQYLFESVFLAFLALLLAIVLIALLLPQFNQITGKQLQLDLNPTFILPVIGITLFTGLLSGCYPAFYLSGFNPLAVLKGRLPTSAGEIWIRKGLVVFQFALSVVFIIGFIVIKKQVDFVQTKNLGFNRENIITFEREGKIKGDAETFLSALKTIPGVVNVGCIAGSILEGGDSQSGFTWSGQEAEKDHQFQSPRISYDVIETLGLKVLKGRSFSKQFNDDDKKFILNESAVKKMGLTDPIGKIVKTFDGDCEIVGVVNDFQYGSLYHRIEPLVFRFRKPRDVSNVLVKIKAGSEHTSIKQIESYYKKFHPDYPFEYSFLDAEHEKLYASEQRISVLSRYFAGLAIIISCLGLFGLAAFTAKQRQKEIGIRKVIGATVNNIIFMLSKDFLQLVLIAIIIAFPFSWWAMSEWLQSFAYRVDLGVAIFLIAGISILLITLVTISFQAITAAVANPVKSLRTE